MQADTVLVVDDNIVNRKLLTKILCDKYNVLLAENGKVALDILKAKVNEIAAVLLDLIMPVMDGFEFLHEVSNNRLLINTPVIITTGNNEEQNEIKALQQGAWDFISKPYNPDIIHFRLKNAIARSELSVLQQLKYIAEYDSLTGIYNKNNFFAVTHQMLAEHTNSEFIFIRFDIDRFSLINSFFGVTEGDKVLKYIAKQMSLFLSSLPFYTYGRIEADIFAACIPVNSIGSSENPENAALSINKARELLINYNSNFDIVPSFGLYRVPDNSITPDILYDRATLASKACKGSYIKLYAWYDDKMGADRLKEQNITNEMGIALNENQFVAYLQPKYDITANKVAGAEALVRWFHPEKGMISPGDFIPVFERNGFISKLDYYMWETICKLIRSWLDEGKPTIPISVNVSRVNLYNPKLVDIICNLTEKYMIPNELFNLELTESSYMDNPTVMIETMTRLQEKGFVIMMDDFGSGYSSLNILKDISVDVLKIDMRFLSKTKIPGRGESIIASVVRMAKWLDIPVIAEGAETAEQVSFLRSIGCEYVQGYYYSKPIPVADFETLVKKEFSGELKKREEQKFNADTLWSADSQINQLFSDIGLATAIYEFEDGRIEPIRVNSTYYDLFGNNAMNDFATNCILSGKTNSLLKDAFQKAISNMDTEECEYLYNLSNTKKIYLHLQLRYIATVGQKHLLLGIHSDITKQKEMDVELQKYKATFMQNSTEKKVILVVDDDETSRALLSSIFSKKYTVIEAENGKKALEQLNAFKKKVDIILLDLLMPVMNGLDFLKYRQKDANLVNIPVIIISVDDSPKQQGELISMGINDYVTKPFVPGIVIKRVDNVLDSIHNLRVKINDESKEGKINE